MTDFSTITVSDERGGTRPEKPEGIQFCDLRPEPLNRAVQRMTDRIVSILNRDVHSIWLYGSVVLDDFRPGTGTG